jgi:aspartyl-tRNA synthetase
MLLLCCRYGLEFVDVSSALSGCGFRVFESALSSGGVVKAIRVPEGKRISNSRLKAPKGDVVAEAMAAGEDHQHLGPCAALSLPPRPCLFVWHVIYMYM